MRGAIAAGHSFTAQCGAEILRDGGNAFDAMIAAIWAACVVEPVLISPAGGGFLMAKMAGKKPQLLDFFVQTPKQKNSLGDVEFTAINADFGPAKQEFHIGSGSAATPCLVPGLFEIHRRFATRPMRVLAEQAVEIAKNGWRISAFQANLLQIVGAIYAWQDDAKAIFCDHDGLLKRGRETKNPSLAMAIEAIAIEGERLFREGEIAQAMVGFDGSLLELEDLKSIEVVEREPIKFTHKDHTVYLNPYPAAGGTLVNWMLEQSSSNDLLIEEELHSIKTAKIIDMLDRVWENSGYSVENFLKISGKSALSTLGTTHISIVDEHKNVAAATMSNGAGNGHIVPDCGFMMNNMLGEEDLNKDGFFSWKEDTRLSSMMAPTILTDVLGNAIALGTGGSNRIRSTVFQIIDRLVNSSEKSLGRVIEAPRIHVESGHLDFEDFFSEEERLGLQQNFEDHLAWPELSMFFGGVHLARVETKGGLDGGSDPRRSGVYIKV